MRTRTRTDSPVGQRLDLSWDTDSSVGNAQVNDEAVTSPLPQETMQEDKPQETTQETVPATAVPVSPSETPQDMGQESDVAQPSPAESSANNEEKSQEKEENPLETTLPDASLSPSPALPVKETESLASDAFDAPSPEDKQKNSLTEPDSASLEPQGEIKDDSLDKDASQSVASSSKTSRKSPMPVNIIPKDERVGVVLMRNREEANVKIEDLAKRLNIDPLVIRNLESGDYDSLCRTYGKDNSIYIVMFFKSIGEELGISKNEIDSLVEKLYAELATAGHPFDVPLKREDEVTEYKAQGHRRPVKSILPKLIVFALFAICLLIFFLSVVVPYVSRTRSGKEKRIDYVPLIEQPWKSPRTIKPQQLPVP
ncbi:MAG: helix-turn-helix domain-containing protein [Victivallales bacterium]|nr:helix-turn-helix domain-containing protein [Victivallales bacterium]